MAWSKQSWFNTLLLQVHIACEVRNSVIFCLRDYFDHIFHANSFTVSANCSARKVTPTDLLQLSLSSSTGPSLRFSSCNWDLWILFLFALKFSSLLRLQANRIWMPTQRSHCSSPSNAVKDPSWHPWCCLQLIFYVLQQQKHLWNEGWLWHHCHRKKLNKQM